MNGWNMGLKVGEEYREIKIFDDPFNVETFQVMEIKKGWVRFKKVQSGTYKQSETSPLLFFRLLFRRNKFAQQHSLKSLGEKLCRVGMIGMIVIGVFMGAYGAIGVLMVLIRKY